MNTWVHLHPLAAIAIVSLGAGLIGFMLGAVLFGNDPADAKEAARENGHW